MLLGLDCSQTSTGYALLDDNGSLVEAGTFKTEVDTGISIERFRLIQKEIKKMIKDHKITDVAVEGVVFGSGAKYAKLPTLYALYIQVQVVLADLDTRVVYFAPKQWRKLLWEPSRWKKLKEEQMPLELQIDKHEYQSETKQATINLLKKKYGVRLKPDEADAFGIALAGRTFFQCLDNKKTQLTQDEQEVFYKTSKSQDLQVESGLVNAKNRLWFDFKEDLWKTTNVSIKQKGYPKE